MPNHSRSKREEVESTIPDWLIFAALATAGLIVAKSIHGALLFLAAAGMISLFILIYMTKPVAVIQPRKEETIFDKNKINRSTWKNPSEPNAQRKRYLRSIEDIDKAA